MTSNIPINQEPKEAPAEKSAGVTSDVEALNTLKALALDEASIHKRLKEVQNAKYIAGKLALKGQITVFYAGPNTGKTLICLRLLSDAYQQGLLNEDVYHINLDDDYVGATTKAMIGLNNGFRVITPETFTHPLANFKELIKFLITSGAADRTIFVLDTIKKFADVMDKKAMSEFLTECRKLTSAGGSIIALAHTNKITNDENKVIPGGTSDLLDDCDCAYVLYTASEEPADEGLRRFIKFEQRKSRGPTTREALYSYVVNDEGDYTRLFHSVQNEAPSAVQEAQKSIEIQKEKNENAGLIKAITEALKTESTSQTTLVETVQKLTSASRNEVKNCLARWNLPAAEGGLWSTTKGDNNSTIFHLH